MYLTVIDPSDSLHTDLVNSQPPELVEIAEGVLVKWECPMIKGGNFPRMVWLTISLAGPIATDAAADLVANWLESRFGAHSEKITYEREEFEFDRGGRIRNRDELRRVLREKLTVERTD